MFKRIKEFLDSKKPISKLAKKPLGTRIVNSVVNTTKDAISQVPGGGITVTAVTLTTLAFTMGHLLAMASIAGIVLSISMACLYAGAPKNLQSSILWGAAKFGWYADILITCVLTYMGFQLGATLGIVAMVLGLHMSMLMSIARWSYSRRPVGNLAIA